MAPLSSPRAVALVAAVPMVQAGLARALTGRFDIVAIETSLGALQRALAARPSMHVDVALVQAGAGTDTLDIAPALAANVGIVVLSDADPADLAPLAAAGAACLPTAASDREIAAAIDAVSAGLVALRPDFLNDLLRRAESTAPRPQAELIEPLTPRERQVLALLAGGLANKRIAHDLGISEHTAKFHVGRILDKLDAATRAEAVAIGLRDGLIAAE